ncbi:MAG: preprotein translocase subunit SecE [bacterium]
MAENKVRKVKNPETFRERALKAQEPKISNKTRANSLLSSALNPLRTSLNKIAKIKALKPIFIVLNKIGKVIFPSYFRNSFKELKQVTWPSVSNGIKLTWAVIVFAIVFGLSISALDWGLTKVFKNILLR